MPTTASPRCACCDYPTGGKWHEFYLPRHPMYQRYECYRVCLCPNCNKQIIWRGSEAALVPVESVHGTQPPTIYAGQMPRQCWRNIQANGPDRYAPPVRPNPGSAFAFHADPFGLEGGIP